MENDVALGPDTAVRLSKVYLSAFSSSQNVTRIDERGKERSCFIHERTQGSVDIATSAQTLLARRVSKFRRARRAELLARREPNMQRDVGSAEQGAGECSGG